MSRRMTIPLVALLLLLAPLAGCLGADGQEEGADEASPDSIEGQGLNASANETFPEPSVQDQGTDEEDDEDDEPRRELVSYAGIEEPFQEILVEEGSFGAHESCLAGGCATQFATGDQPHTDRVEVTSQAPLNVPVEVTVNVTYESNDETPFSMSSMYAFIEVHDGSIFSYNQGTEYGDDVSTTWAKALVVLDGSSELYGAVSATMAEPPSQDYEMEIGLEADPHTVPEFVPVEVGFQDAELAPMVGVSENASDVDLRVWGPEDMLRYEAEDLQPDQPHVLDDVESGEHVLAAVGAEDPMRLAVSSDASAEMRALPLDVEFADAHDVGTEGQAQWDATIDHVPFSVGVYIQANSQTFSYSEGEVTFSSPEGTVVTTDSVWCFPCLTDEPGVVAMWSASPFDDGIVAGDWEGEASFQTAANVGVGHFLVNYRR